MKHFIHWLSLLLGLLAAPALPPAQAQTLTSVVDTLYNADGTTANGRIFISWDGFTQTGGVTVAGGTLSYTLTAGEVDIDLAYNSPNGFSAFRTAYRVHYFLTTGSGYSETWLVPSVGPVTIGQIAVTRTPPSTNLVGFIPRASTTSGFLFDGGSTNLVCGAANQGRAQVMDDGTLQYCDGAATSALRVPVLTATNQTIAGIKNFSGSVGIGTTAPEQLLHVKRSTAGHTSAFENTNATGSASTPYKNDAGNVVFQGLGGSGLTDGTANKWFVVYNDIGQVMVMDSTGKVGVGTTGPTARLEVNGASLTTPVLFTSASGTAAANLALSNIQQHTLTEDTTLLLSSVIKGQEVTFIIIQHASAAKTFTWDSRVIGGMTVSAALGSINIQKCVVSYAGTNLYCFAGVTGLSGGTP